MANKFFYISSRGATATNWLCSLLNTHPEILALHGTRCIPPLFSGVGDMSANEFFRQLPNYTDLVKPKAKILGGAHGFYGNSAHEATSSRNGIFLGLTRHPINRINSFLSLAFQNLSPVSQIAKENNGTASIYQMIKNDYLDVCFDRFHAPQPAQLNLKKAKQFIKKFTDSKLDNFSTPPLSINK